MSTLSKIAELRREISDLTSSLGEKVAELRRTRRSLWLARLRKRYYAFARRLRQPGEQYTQWFLGVLLVGSVAVAAMIFVLLYLVSLPGLLIALGTLLAGVGAGVFFATAMTTPPTETLAKRIAEEDATAVELRNQVAQLKSEEGVLRQDIARRRGAIRELEQSDQQQRRHLMRQNWQEMRGAEWQAFVGEVFQHLGGEIDATTTAGDPRVDLLVQFGVLKIAVQAEGNSYDQPIGHQAVERVVAGKAHFGCDRSAVISNSRFTKSAVELARSNSCYLIGRKEFESFVMGSNLELLR